MPQLTPTDPLDGIQSRLRDVIYELQAVLGLVDHAMNMRKEETTDDEPQPTDFETAIEALGETSLGQFSPEGDIAGRGWY